MQSIMQGTLNHPDSQVLTVLPSFWITSPSSTFSSTSTDKTGSYDVLLRDKTASTRTALLGEDRIGIEQCSLVEKTSSLLARKKAFVFAITKPSGRRGFVICKLCRNYVWGPNGKLSKQSRYIHLYLIFFPYSNLKFFPDITCTA